ncbi:hypothetical protein CathTA2_1096 [Caldalkalibacillus thermarum TA2.A1]|uniref:Uncharacterized protein n=1 Tax=Caldalkalibacillus thermarum (strain TA2.A1) TaxID=986075 RepID=F5L5N3_CALTT|nr:hypothetical protein CathTA2_1096 [Caldalkalibacillus thermarum TA2.A1]
MIAHRIPIKNNKGEVVAAVRPPFCWWVKAEQERNFLPMLFIKKANGPMDHLSGSIEDVKIFVIVREGE